MVSGGCKDNEREVENMRARTQREIRHSSSAGVEDNGNQSTGILAFREEDQVITSLNYQDRHKAVP